VREPVESSGASSALQRHARRVPPHLYSRARSAAFRQARPKS
jgi:hypothetical protein